jgi:hypothetical protein
MNSNHLPANWDLARGLVEKVQGLEKVQGWHWYIADQLEAGWDLSHKSIHICPSSHSSHSHTGQHHNLGLHTRCKPTFLQGLEMVSLQGLEGVLALAEVQEAN